MNKLKHATMIRLLAIAMLTLSAMAFAIIMTIITFCGYVIVSETFYIASTEAVLSWGAMIFGIIFFIEEFKKAGDRFAVY